MLVYAKQAIITAVMHPTMTFIQLQTVAPLPFHCGLPESVTPC